MADDYKALNPSSKLIEGRFGGILYFVNKAFSECSPNFSNHIVVEDRVNISLECEFPKIGDVQCRLSNLFNGSWSFMRPPGSVDNNAIVMMLGMADRDAGDNVPRRIFVFRVKDVESKIIKTKAGEKEATFFDSDASDTWAQFSGDANCVAMVVRSIECGSVDPDIPAGPFKSYLTTLISGEAAPAAPEQSSGTPAESNGPSMDFDDDVPF